MLFYVYSMATLFIIIVKNLLWVNTKWAISNAVNRYSTFWVQASPIFRGKDNSNAKLIDKARLSIRRDLLELLWNLYHKHHYIYSLHNVVWIIVSDRGNKTYSADENIYKFYLANLAKNGQIHWNKH